MKLSKKGREKMRFFARKVKAKSRRNLKMAVSKILREYRNFTFCDFSPFHLEVNPHTYVLILELIARAIERKNNFKVWTNETF